MGAFDVDQCAKQILPRVFDLGSDGSSFFVGHSADLARFGVGDDQPNSGLGSTANERRQFRIRSVIGYADPI